MNAVPPADGATYTTRAICEASRQFVVVPPELISVNAAYYLKRQNRRPEYVMAWFYVVNWPQVSQALSALIPPLMYLGTPFTPICLLVDPCQGSCSHPHSGAQSSLKVMNLISSQGECCN